jgi:hypothetical protein
LIYPPELEVKETTDTASSASLLDLYLEFDDSGQLSTMKMTFQEIRIIATGPCIANQLRDVYTICRRSWYIAAHFGGTLFQQVVGIPMGTNCAPLLADLFLYSYESEFLQKLVKDKKIHEARTFNFTYRYIDDVLSINNEDDVSGNQNNCHWPLHSESIARCKHHMQENLVSCCTYLENL